MYRLEKELRILNELTNYCVKNGSKDVNINYRIEKEYTELYVCAKKMRVSEKKLNDLIRKLNVGRRYDVEENYWMLGGESEQNGESEMTLVGMMVDEADIQCIDGNLEMRVLRKQQ